MAGPIWLHDGGQLLLSVRLAFQVNHAEFADILGAELGWLVPAVVLQAWEKGTGEPPPGVVDTARRLAESRLVRTLGRREFLRRSAEAATGLTLVGARTSPPRLPRDVAPTVTVRGQLHMESLTDLDALVADYRSAYGQAASDGLLSRSTGLVHTLLDLQRASQAPAVRHRLTSLLGQAAVLSGLLSLMGTDDQASARSFYDLALSAAGEAGDADLATYVSGSLSFLDTRAGRPVDGVHRIRAALEVVDERSAPATRAWLASLASELHSRMGDESESKRRLDQAEQALDADTGEVIAWKGVGTFDRGKLIAYRGGDLVLLATQGDGTTAVRRAREAEAVLVDALSKFDPSRLKHRCTALGDVALALALRDEVEQACARAGEALDLAEQIGHAESVERVRRTYRRLIRWSSHAAVRELRDRLLTPRG